MKSQFNKFNKSNSRKNDISFLGGIRIADFKLSAIEFLGSDLQFELEPETLEKTIIINLLRNRLQSRRRFLISSVQDLREDQPATSLQTGSSQSLTVCRISRYFPREAFQNFIENIIDIIAQEPRIAENFDSIPKLKEVFLIPDKIADDIYKELEGNLPKRLSQSSSFEKRSRYSLECSKILLDGLKNLKESQLAYLNPIPVGSGFLVGATHLLTNHHVLFDEEVARQCVAQFKYEESLGISQKQVDYELDPDTFFIKELSLDYALVQLKFNPLTRQAGHNFGWLQLIEDDSNILPDISNCQDILQRLKDEHYEILDEEKKGDNVILIHHPKGRQKQVNLTNNRVTSGGLYKKFLRFQGESDYGSSGCPVFNTKWELVALNHAAVTQRDILVFWYKWHRIIQNNQASKVEVIDLWFASLAYYLIFGRGDKTLLKQGVRICAIIADLKQKANNSPRLKGFIEDFVIISEQIKYPPLPAALNFGGLKNFIQIKAPKLSSTQEFSIESWVNFTGQQDRSTLFTAFCKEDWAEEESTLGDVILQCYLTLGEELVFARKKIFGIYPYPANSMLYPSNRLALFYPKRYLLSPSLRVGEKGVRVTEFKKFIKLIPGLQINLEDGDLFSEEDSEEIKEFQKSYDDKKKKPLIVDGIVGSKTLDALWRLVQFKETGISHPATGDIKYLMTLINEGLKEPFPSSILESLQSANNVLCENTKAAIKHFQKTRRLQETGVIDSTFLDALWFYGLYLRKGNKGPGVKDLQSLIQGIGGDVPNSGEFDKCTERFVRQYQADQRLDSDGIVGFRTLNALFRERTYCYELRTQNSNLSVTKESVQEFQSDHNLEQSNNGLTSDENDGVVNPETKEKMVEKTSLNLGVQNHIAVTYGDKMIRLLVNGKELCLNEDKLKISNDPTCLLIGAYAETPEQIGDNCSCYFQGSLAELRIWNCNRAEPIKEDLETGNFYKRLSGNEPGLVGYWRFEETEIFEGTASNQPKPDNQPEPKKMPSQKDDQELEALYYGEPRSVLATQFPALPLPFGVEFKEAKDYIVIENFKFNKPEEKSITLEAWVQYNFGDGYILCQGDENGKDRLALGFSNGRVVVEFNGASKKAKVEMENSFPNDSVWHHVAVTLNSESEIWMYLDGRVQPVIVVESEKVDSIVVQDRRLSIVKFQEKLNIENCPLYIGKREKEENYFHVSISEVRLWKIPRSQDDIKKFQFFRLRGNEEGLVGYWRLDDGGPTALVRDSSSERRRDGRRSVDGHLRWYPSPTKI